MIVKDLSPFVDEKGEIPLAERIRGTFRYGSNWYDDFQSQEVIIGHLQNALNDEFTVIRNLMLPGLDVTIPLILVGPSGVQIIYASASKGIFQAKGEQWRGMDTLSRRFKEAKPNLINRALLLTQAIHRYLEGHELAKVPLEPVMIFTNPGIHVDSKGPAVRIVMIDALDRYAASLASAPGTVSMEDVQKVVGALTDPSKARAADAQEEQRIREAFTMRTPAYADKNVTEVNLPVVGRLAFSNRQWLLLGGLLILDLIVLGGFILLTLFLS